MTEQIMVAGEEVGPSPFDDPPDRPGRRGRPRAGEFDKRRMGVLDAASEEMVDTGYERVTMLGIAQRAGASKETLYSWFSNKEGLLTALIEREIDDTATAVQAAVAISAPPAAQLTAIARVLLDRAASATSIAVRRAAVTSLRLGATALEQERLRLDPVITEYLAELPEHGPYLVADAPATTRLFRGLALQDLELRLLLGDAVPSTNEIEARAHAAVERFLTLVTVTERPTG
ncbi:MAG: TetR/AcrR family transcriptional regulator [Actinomycetota bacterium]